MFGLSELKNNNCEFRIKTEIISREIKNSNSERFSLTNKNVCIMFVSER